MVAAAEQRGPLAPQSDTALLASIALEGCSERSVTVVVDMAGRLSELYLTVEDSGDEDLGAAFREARGRSLPVVYGESVTEDGGYHYFPPQEAVAHWLRQTGFVVVEEASGDWYDHYLLQRVS